jgi:uncharacterized membrane protein
MIASENLRFPSQTIEGGPAAALGLTSAQENGLVHYYRGELGRLAGLGARLDTTANWALSAAAGISTFAMSNGSIAPAVMLMLMFLAFVFLSLEARRYLEYRVSAARIRLLETGFFPGLLRVTSDDAWLPVLLEQLRNPTASVGFWQALGLRLRRLHWAIFAWALVLWVFLLERAGTKTTDFGALVERAAFSIVPGWLICTLVLGFYGFLALAAWRTRHVPDIQELPPSVREGEPA